MKTANAIMTAFCLTIGFSIPASAEPLVESVGRGPSEAQETGNNLDAEYQKLLQIVKAKRNPVQTIDGALGIAGRPGIGPKNADVILVEFGDFQCPYCRRHLLGAAQQISEKLVAMNRVRYVFMDFPIEAKHPLAVQAATAAHCAEEQNKYWEMRNTLYANQKALHALLLVEHAKSAGLDEAAFTICLESGRHDAAIQQDQAIGKSLGIKGTPTFFVGINQGDEITLVRKINGTQPYEVFEREIIQAGEVAKQRRIQERISQSGPRE